MKRKLGSLFAGAGTMMLAVLGVPAATATATAASAAAVTAGPSAQTFNLTKVTTTVKFIGTTKFAPTKEASGAPASTTAKVGRVQAPNEPNIGKGLNPAGRPGPKRPGAQQSASSLTAPETPATTTLTTTSGAATVEGINAFGQGLLHPTYTPTRFGVPGLAVEPPDQGLCSNGTYTVEVNNEVMRVFTGTSLSPVTGTKNGMALENLFTAPEIFGVTSAGGTVNIQGDPRCQWDPTSGRWFASQIWLTESGFKSASNARFGWAGTFVAVSQTTNPAGSWNVFFVPDQFNAQKIDNCNNTPITALTRKGHRHLANPCFGDQPLLGINGNSVFISVNDFPILTLTGPFGVANTYFLNKSDLVSFTATTHRTLSPIWWTHEGDTLARPGAPVTCPADHCTWYSIAPAVSDGTYPSTTLYAMSNVTFTTTGGTQVALWQFDTAAISTTGTTLAGSVAITSSEKYTEPPLAVQASGTTPLGTLWKQIQFRTTHKKTHLAPPTPGPIQTNTDRITTAAYDPATGDVWGALNTGVTVTGANQAGIAWSEVTPPALGSSFGASTETSGYVSVRGADVYYPSISFTNRGAGLMDFGFSGSTYHPSAAFVSVKGTTPSVTPTAHVAHRGTGPQDSFTEYTSYGTSTFRPRWGDYSMALASGTTFYFATETIFQTCSTAEFQATLTCGTTRSELANWSTSVSKL
jgi:hypothetical protein